MKVLIVGGGIAGLTAATSLRKIDKIVSITLVDPKDYCEVYWASIRGLFDETMIEKNPHVFSIAKWAVSKSVTIVQQKVTNLNPETHTATLADGNILEFNVAIICTGAQTKVPALGRGPPRRTGSLERRLVQLQTERNKLLQANSVVIVGGGLVGTEFAGDLAYYSKKSRNGASPMRITLIHSKPHLCDNEFTPKASKMVLKKLQGLGVEVKLNAKATSPSKSNDNENTTSSVMVNGKVLDADHVLWTTGNYACNASFLDKKYLDAKGWLKVDDYFRVIGAEESLFALGDCCDLLPNAGVQILGTMNVIGKNIQVTLDALQSGMDTSTSAFERKMRKALAQPNVCVTTLGKETGVAQTPCCHTQFILPWVKNSNMFLFKPKSELGLK